MQRRTFIRLGVLGPLSMASNHLFGAVRPADVYSDKVPDGKPHHFCFSRQRFMLDGSIFQIRSGQIDPIRIPRDYWCKRIRMAKAMGLNTISSYLVWNVMEGEPGQFDMKTGRLDFARFIELCAQEGMWVYLRPGPYICGERDFGGLPVWLLRDPNINIRNASDEHFMGAVAQYFDAIAPVIRPLMSDNGGPVLMVQIENEYASFGHDLNYLKKLELMWRERGIDGPFSISDGLSELLRANTYEPGAALGLDPGLEYAKAQVVAGEAPVFEGEGYPGHLSHWGDRDIPVGSFDMALRQLMESGRSFNIYEINGGTNFGFGAGANCSDDGSNFKPDITSYDRGDPIDERGVPTDEYYRLRTIISSATKQSPIAVPDPSPAITFAPTKVRPWASIWDNLPKPYHAERPQANELLTGQLHGMVLYRKTIELNESAVLQINGVHDYATVFANGCLLGNVSRLQRKDIEVSSGNTFLLSSEKLETVTLDVLVDSFGHVNYGHYLDRKGLTEDVLLNGTVLCSWQVFSLPLHENDILCLRPSKRDITRPGIFFRSTVYLERLGDCYVDMNAWDKGYVWINNHLLGRYWSIGPQQRLYCPAEWWRKGASEVIIFDQHRTAPANICGRETLYY